MVALTYSSLDSTLAGIIGRTPDDLCYTLVTTDINDRLRLKCMERTVTLSVAASINLVATISGATKANPCVITATAHGFSTGAEVNINNVVGMTELNGDSYTITKVDADSFSLDDIDSSAYTTYTSGGTASLALLSVESIYLDSTPPALLRPATSQNIQASYEAARVPTQYALVDDKLLLNGAGGSDSIELRYYARQPELSGEDTNDILTFHQGVYVYGALYHHYRLTRDYPAAREALLDYERAMRQAQTSSDTDRLSGQPLEPYAGTTP